jgi:uncharacterized protein YhaN
MRFTDLTIDGFGVWSGLEICDLATPLTVIYGANEAGKTTVLQAIRGTLYGFNEFRRERYLPPLHGGVGTTRLGIEAKGARYSVLRRDDGASRGSVVVTSDDATTQGEPHLQRLLDGVNESTFSHIFGIGLRELQELATLDDTEAADLLYDLSTGLERVSLSEVLRELKNSRTRLLASDGTKSQILELASHRAALVKEIDELSAQTPRYFRLLTELAATDQAIEAVESQANEFAADIRRVEAAILVRESWQERQSLADQIAAAGKQGNLPPHALARFDRILERLNLARRRRKQLRRKRQALRTQLRGIAINEPFWRQSAKVAALAEHETWIAELESNLLAADARLATLEAQHADELARLGLPVDSVSPAAPLQAGAVSTLREPGKQLRVARKRLVQARREFADERKAKTERQNQIQTALSSRGQQSLADALHKQGELVSAYRRRIQIDERLDQMALHRQDLDGRQSSLLDQQILPLWLLWTLAAVFVVGAGLIIGGLLLPASVTGAWGWPLAFLGVLIAGASIAGKFIWERSAAARLESTKRQLHMLERQLEQAKAERGELDASLPAGGGPLASRLQAAERELASLEELLSLDAHRQASEETSQAARRRLKQAGEDWQKARRRWQQALGSVGLPANLLPRHVKQVNERATGLSSLQQQLEQARSDRERCRRELSSLASRIEPLTSSAALSSHVPSTSTSLVDQLRRLRREMAAQEELVARRAELSQRIEEATARHSRYGVRVRRLVRLRRELFRAASATTDAEFRERAAEQARTEELIARNALLDREIRHVLKGVCILEQVTDLLSGDAESLEKTRELLLARRQAAGDQTRALFEQRGRLVHERAALESDRRLGQKRQELGIVEQRLQETAARWRSIATTEHYLHAVKEEYERNRQPEVLRDASGYLARMTGGRYSRVWTSVDEHALRVERDGESLAIELLSSGAREQLFLSLRLALADRFARQGKAMPLVLDDVLVNFDAERASAAAALFVDWATEGRQVLLFTCHEHIADRFAALRADVRRLPENKDASRKIVAPDRTIETHEPELEPRKPRVAKQLATTRERTSIVIVEDEPATPVIPVEVPQTATPTTDVELASVQLLAVPSSTVLDESVISPSLTSAPVVEPAKHRPARRRRADTPHRLSPPPSLRRRRWAAEEFDGELADQVNDELAQAGWWQSVDSNGAVSAGGRIDAN